ncbi:hypothetical protein ACE6H2_023692 [Prunus campanulata]
MDLKIKISLAILLFAALISVVLAEEAHPPKNSGGAHAPKHSVGGAHAPKGAASAPEGSASVSAEAPAPAKDSASAPQASSSTTPATLYLVGSLAGAFLSFFVVYYLQY